MFTAAIPVPSDGGLGGGVSVQAGTPQMFCNAVGLIGPSLMFTGSPDRWICWLELLQESEVTQCAPYSSLLLLWVVPLAVGDCSL